MGLSIALAGQLIFVIVALLIDWWTQISLWQSLGSLDLALIVGVGGAALLAVKGALIRIAMPRLSARLDQLNNKVFADIRLTIPNIALLSLAAGIGEELLFRGALQGWLSLHTSTAVSIVLPAAVFGAFHAHIPACVVVTFLGGLILGWLYWWTGSLLGAIVAHVFFDFASFSYLRITRKRLLRQAGLD